MQKRMDVGEEKTRPSSWVGLIKEIFDLKSTDRILKYFELILIFHNTSTGVVFSFKCIGRLSF